LSKGRKTRAWVEGAGWDDDRLDPTVIFEAGEKQTETNQDIQAWFSAARMEIIRDKSLSAAQRKSKIAALKAQRKLRQAARKADREARKLRATRRTIAPKPRT
jgi:hypothetical protein